MFKPKDFAFFGALILGALVFDLVQMRWTGATLYLIAFILAIADDGKKPNE